MVNRVVVFPAPFAPRILHDFAFVNAKADPVQDFFRAVAGLKIFDFEKHPNSRIVMY